MKITEFSKDIERRTGIGVYAQFMNIVLLIAVIALSIALAKADRTHRETLIPPSINKTFWVEDDRVSPEYLEQMGLFLIQLTLNRTPANGDQQLETLLRYVSPDSYAVLKKQMVAELQRQQEDQVTTMFHARSVTVQEGRTNVMFEGTLITYVADKPVKNEEKRYMIKFAYHGGRTYIMEMLDVTAEKEPFNG